LHHILAAVDHLQKIQNTKIIRRIYCNEILKPVSRTYCCSLSKYFYVSWE